MPRTEDDRIVDAHKTYSLKQLRGAFIAGRFSNLEHHPTNQGDYRRISAMLELAAYLGRRIEPSSSAFDFGCRISVLFPYVETWFEYPTSTDRIDALIAELEQFSSFIADLSKTESGRDLGVQFQALQVILSDVINHMPRKA